MSSRKTILRLRSRQALGGYSGSHPEKDIPENIIFPDLPTTQNPNFCLDLKSKLIEFIDKKYSIPSHSLTNQEILKQLKTKNNVIYNDFKHILDQCNNWKYAKKELNKEELLEKANNIKNSLN